MHATNPGGARESDRTPDQAENEARQFRRIEDLAAEIGSGRIGTAPAPGTVTESADQFAAHLIWTGEEAMLPERTYGIRIAGAEATVQITDLSYRIDPDTHEHLAAKTLSTGEVAYCKIALDHAVRFEVDDGSPRAGTFELLDEPGGTAIGAGIIDFALWRSTNVAWQALKLDKRVRAEALGQRPRVLWFTGLSGAGKSTIADLLEQKLHATGQRTYLLDGDNVRHGLNKDLGFTDQDRVENIRRIAEVARLMADAGLIVLVSFISPFRSERRMARSLMDDGDFIEIFVDAPIEVCESRDPKGLYKKARAGEIRNFTGIDSDYEPPEAPEITLKTAEARPDALVDTVVEYLTSTES